MANYILSFVVQTEEPDFGPIVDDVVNSLTADGHTPTEVRVTSDAGEQVLPVEITTEEPPVESPADETPTDEPQPEETTNA